MTRRRGLRFGIRLAVVVGVVLVWGLAMDTGEYLARTSYAMGVAAASIAYVLNEYLAGDR